MKVFSYDFGVAGIVHFPLFEVYCNKRTPLHLSILKVFTSCSCGNKVLEKIIWVLEKRLIFPKKFCMDHVKDQSFFSLVITFLLLMTFSIDDVGYRSRLEKIDVEHSWDLKGYILTSTSILWFLWFLTVEIIIVSPCYNVHVSSINFYSGNTWKLCLPRMKVTFYLLQQSMAVSKGKNTLKFFGNSWTELSSNKVK